MSYVKKSRTKLYLALLLVVILIVAAGAVVYAAMNGPKPVQVGVQVGDTFTYSIKGMSTLTGIDAVESDGFYLYNQTDYYKIVITDLNGTSVTMDTKWRFLNGTEINSPQTIDIASGQKTDENGFWALYPANLNIGDLLRPRGYDQTHVNNTDTGTYTSGDRARCFWFINNQFSDVRDPTQSTLMYDYRNIFFDRATGILVSFQNYQFYNNPEREEVITWVLVDSSVWQV